MLTESPGTARRNLVMQKSYVQREWSANGGIETSWDQPRAGLRAECLRSTQRSRVGRNSDYRDLMSQGTVAPEKSVCAGRFVLHIGIEDFLLLIVGVLQGVEFVSRKSGVSRIGGQKLGAFVNLLEHSFLFARFGLAGFLSGFGRSFGRAPDSLCIVRPPPRSRQAQSSFVIRDAVGELCVGGKVRWMLGKLSGFGLR